MAFQRLSILAEAFSETQKLAVWNKGTVIQGYDPRIWRRDMCGYAMKYDKYGVCGEYGWEIDHIRPVAKGGSDDLFNLQPLFWENNRRKGDTFPWYG
ncbi:HNH endonuclease [Microvirga sp. 17 mud 1-3]|uniref:HNH endonuclease n=1 Tax=Microvirga sp. 17 mud 1-3 TaxID=2082949 RepID=UPI000D6D8B0C|nr:HNH endonuclease signature motif containing protein [Microvirga sp. 17 mud 1-3]AWM88622.1 HNH endonuclease [Microvirga sp. 17 mud 1-3]